MAKERGIMGEGKIKRGNTNRIGQNKMAGSTKLKCIFTNLSSIMSTEKRGELGKILNKGEG